MMTQSFIMEASEIKPPVNLLQAQKFPIDFMQEAVWHVNESSINETNETDMAQARTRLYAAKALRRFYESAKKDKCLDTGSLLDVSEHLLSDVVNKHANLSQLTKIRVHDSCTFIHSVNVAIFSALIGKLCQLSPKELRDLTTGALLHDLGKVNVPDAILNKPARLTQEEFACMKKHPKDGARQILDMQDILPEPDIIATIAAEHHEQISGKGYPYGLSGDEIHKYAKIVAIADVYDALTSARPYKNPYTPSTAHNIMANVSKGQFDPVLLRLFFNNIALYPTGTIVKTDYGIAIVKECEYGRTETPVIILFADEHGQVLDKPRTIDLAQEENGNKKISTSIPPEELWHYVHSFSCNPYTLLMQ